MGFYREKNFTLSGPWSRESPRDSPSTFIVHRMSLYSEKNFTLSGSWSRESSADSPSTFAVYGVGFYMVYSPIAGPYKKDLCARVEGCGLFLHLAADEKGAEKQDRGDEDDGGPGGHGVKIGQQQSQHPGKQAEDQSQQVVGTQISCHVAGKRRRAESAWR